MALTILSFSWAPSKEVMSEESWAKMIPIAKNKNSGKKNETTNYCCDQVSPETHCGLKTFEPRLSLKLLRSVGVICFKAARLSFCESVFFFTAKQIQPKSKLKPLLKLERTVFCKNQNQNQKK